MQVLYIIIQVIKKFKDIGRGMKMLRTITAV
jgi:hypothetical protein